MSKARREAIVALDIGTTKICAIVGRPIDGEIEIMGVGTCPSYGLRKGIVVDMKRTVASISASLKRAERACKTEIKSACVGITGAHVTSLNSRGGIDIAHGDHIVTEKDRNKAIEAACAVDIPPNSEVIHIVSREFFIDGQGGVKDPLGIAALRLEAAVHIVMGAVTSIQNIVRCVNQAGIDVKDIVLQPIASCEAVLSDEERELGTILVDIGGGTTDIAIFSEGSIWYSSVLPLGGNQVTHDLAVGLKVLLSEAESLKIEHGCAFSRLVDELEIVEVNTFGKRRRKPVPRKLLAEVIEARMREIFNLVRGKVIATGRFELLPGGVVITGGSSLLEGLPELVSEMFDLPVRIGFPKGIVGAVEAVNNPIYSTGVGLLHYAEKSPEIEPLLAARESNFIEEIIERIKGWFRELFNIGKFWH